MLSPRSLSVAVLQIAITIVEACFPCRCSSLVSHQGVSVSFTRGFVGNNVLSLKGLKEGTDGQRIPQIVICGKGNRKS
jgi:hypothetical protein